MNKIIASTNMYISKASLQNGVMSWSAINSDTDWDLYQERMSLDLYHKMLSYIKDGVPPPAPFADMVTSDYWKQGMPYLSIAHYPDLNGTAVPGKPIQLFIDGNQLKAKGILFDTKLGRAVWKSLKADEKSLNDEKIRISIAFLDLAHKHGEDGKVFNRKSINSICPDCIKGEGNKIYLDGYLVHLALTRVPVNPRTIMKSEDAMTKKSQIKTRKEDALSIVGDEELVETIDKSALEVKSDVLIEMSKADDEPDETPEVVVEDSKAKAPDPEPDDDPDDDSMDKKHKKEMKSLTAEDVVEIVKSVLVDALQAPEVTKAVESNVPVVAEVTKSALDIATDELYNSISSSINMQGVALEQRLEAINPALQNLGTTITAMVRESMGVAPAAPVSNDQTVVLEAITSVANTVKELAQEVATLKAQTTSTPQATQSRIPAPRSVQPAVFQSQPATNVNPNSVANIVRRSVSSQLPLK